MANFAPVLGQVTKEMVGIRCGASPLVLNQLPEASAALRAPQAMEERKAGREKNPGSGTGREEWRRGNQRGTSGRQGSPLTFF